MTPNEFLEILSRAAKLKTTPRHCETAQGRRESVADHSWRIALMALLLSGEAEFQGTDMNRVIRMCLIHDLGEAFTGDIPTFEKTDADARREVERFLGWIGGFPSPQREEWLALLGEMEAMETPEAKTYKALDKLEAVIQHNEAPLDTWLPLEYDLNRTYASEECAPFPFLKELREEALRETERKVKDVPAAAQK